MAVITYVEDFKKLIIKPQRVALSLSVKYLF